MPSVCIIFQGRFRRHYGREFSRLLVRLIQQNIMYTYLVTDFAYAGCLLGIRLILYFAQRLYGRRTNDPEAQRDRHLHVSSIPIPRNGRTEMVPSVSFVCGAALQCKSFTVMFLPFQSVSIVLKSTSMIRDLRKILMQRIREDLRVVFRKVTIGTILSGLSMFPLSTFAVVLFLGEVKM